jgi:hypothetical protein
MKAPSCAVSIYGLYAPDNMRTPRYIGATTMKPLRRLSEYMGSKKSGAVNVWIRSLKAAGLRPAIKVLARVPHHLRDDYERRFIAGYGDCLLNGTGGGRRRCKPNEDVRAKLRAAWVIRKAKKIAT